MRAIILTALIAACSAANLDRTYLPPSANTAGGSSDILQTPVSRTNNQGLGGLPTGSYVNNHHGVVVDAAVGTRASNPGQSGLGAPRITYGSTDSKVGEAAFRDKHLQGGPSFIPQGFVDFARPERIQASRDRTANTVRLETNISPETYSFTYETDNGISAGEDGITVDGVQSKGGYSYTGDDGQVYTVTYTADKDGYQPQGAHLPTPPPIPVEILKSLEQNAKDEAAGLVDDGSYDTKKYNAGGDYTESNNNNDSQSNKFANRPGSTAQTSGIFINQNNQALRPNNNGQFGFISTINKDMRQPIGNIHTAQNIPSGFSGFNQQNPLPPSNSGDLDNLKPTQSFSQISQNIETPQPSNSLSGSSQQSKPIQGAFTYEYLPPKQQFVQQQTISEELVKPSLIADNNRETTKLTTSILLSQQNLQNQDQGLIISSSRPSSYDTSINQSNQDSTTSSGFGDSQNFGGSRIPQTPSVNNKFSNIVSPSDGSLQQQSLSNSFSQQQTVFPTSQPSKELTTPFEASPSTNIDYDHKTTNSVPSLENSFNAQAFNQQSTLQETSAQSQISQQESVSNQPSSTYEGQIYNYNKPIQSRPTDAPLSSNTENVNYSQGPDGSFTQISQPFQKPNFVNQNIQNMKPFSTSSIQSRPTDASSLPSSQTTTYNPYTQTQAAETPFTAPPSDVQKPKPLETGTLEGVNKPATNLILQTGPTDNKFVPSTLKPSYNQYSQAQSSFNSQGSSFSMPSVQLNKQPMQNAFLQPRPTSPSFQQTQFSSQNQYTQPQGPDGSYYYDRPSTPINRRPLPSTQTNQLNKLTQRPEFSGQTPNAFSKPLIQSISPAASIEQGTNAFQNPINGLTQASISSFGEGAPTSSINRQPSPTSLSFNQNTQFAGDQIQSQPGSSFAQAIASNQQFLTPSNKPQGFGQSTSSSQDTSPIKAHESEIYQYNKPEQSLPSTPSSESNKEGSGDGFQTVNTQTTIAAIPTQSIDFQDQSQQSLAPQNAPLSKPGQSNIQGASGHKPFSGHLGSTILGSPCCRGNAQFNINGQLGSSQPVTIPEGFKPKEQSQIFTGAEKFETNRKPPRFDSTGYHY